MADIVTWLDLSAHSFGDMKNLLVDSIGLQRDALHIHFGLLIFMIAALLLRGKRRYWTAFLIVLMIALGGEIWDHIYELHIGKACDWPDHLSDIFNTCIWPLLLALFWRWKA